MWPMGFLFKSSEEQQDHFDSGECYGPWASYLVFVVLFKFVHVEFITFSSRETYNALTNWLTDARTLASPNIVIVLVGNKKDLEQEREVTFLEASRFAQENGLFQGFEN